MNIGIETIFDIGENTSVIQDSGDRTEFDSGAVRDMHEGKGRCDLLPLDVVGKFYDSGYSDIFSAIDTFIVFGNKNYLISALNTFTEKVYGNKETMFLELACHYEDGCKKYGAPCELDRLAMIYDDMLAEDSDGNNEHKNGTACAV